MIFSGLVESFVYYDDEGFTHTIKHIEQEGGDEGGSTYCHTVLQIGVNFYKFKYRYYSYTGFDNFEEAYKVTPQRVMITVYK